MKAPIIVDDEGDVLVFDSVKKAERYLEPIDFRHGGSPIYDSEGRLLKVTIRTHRFVERVFLSEDDHTPEHRERLRRVLMAFLRRVSRSEGSYENDTLSELVQRALPFRSE